MKSDDNRISSYCITFFVLFIIIVTIDVASVLVQKNDYLEIENRKIKAFPPVSFSSLCEEKFSTDLEKAFADRIMFREKLIDLKCAFDEIVLQRFEENGIIIGKDGDMFTKRFSISKDTEKLLLKNSSAVGKVADQCGVPVYFIVVPSAMVVKSDSYKKGMPFIDENTVIDQIYDQAMKSSEKNNLKIVDIRSALTDNSDKKLYYYTDHHWTLEGATIAYEEFAKASGIETYEWYKENKSHKNDFYGTHYANTRFPFTISDTIEYYSVFEKTPMDIYMVKGDAQFELSSEETAINVDKFSTYDKYSAFLNGNNGYSEIRGNGSGNILVVKDSYGNCFAPLLINNYEKIGVVDYRNYTYGLKNLVEEGNYDEVLFLYCFQSFVDDKYLINVIRP